MTDFRVTGGARTVGPLVLAAALCAFGAFASSRSKGTLSQAGVLPASKDTAGSAARRNAANAEEGALIAVADSAGRRSGAGALLDVEEVTIRPAPHPLDGLSASELDRLARTLPESLGTVSVGRPNRGRLFNAVELRSGGGLKTMGRDGHHYGTPETVRALRAAVAELHDAFPGSPDVMVGDLSRARGGYLRPHRSHQLGIDVDLGYFYVPPGKWYSKANASNLDRARTWAFVKALIGQGSVEYMFMDRGVQVLLRKYAESIGEPVEWLDTLFESARRRDAPIRHTWGHATHFHVRFHDAVAQESGRRLQARLRRSGKI